MPENNAKCQMSYFILEEDFTSYVYTTATILIANLFQLERVSFLGWICFHFHGVLPKEGSSRAVSWGYSDT